MHGYYIQRIDRVIHEHSSTSARLSRWPFSAKVIAQNSMLGVHMVHLWFPTPAHFIPRSRFICASMSSISSLIFCVLASAVAAARLALSCASRAWRAASSRALPSLAAESVLLVLLALLLADACRRTQWILHYNWAA